MLIFDYPSKKHMKENCIGKTLNYIETSIHGLEYRGTGKLIGCNRPHITGQKREFFAEVTLKNDLIIGVK